MPFVDNLVLSVVEGVTEFLPISTSGHLTLVRLFLRWPDHGIALQAAMHLGMLVAVLIYFWRDVWLMIRGLARTVAGRRDPGARLVWCLILGTLPSLAVGWFVLHYAGTGSRQVEVVGWTMVAFAVVLWLSDRFGLTILRIEHLRASHALIIGICQCLAFLPGASRAGVTMIAGRLLSFERPEAARFSFLLAMPALAAVVVWDAFTLYETGTLMPVREAAVAAFASGGAGLIAIAALMAWLRRASFMPFVVYRLLFGAALLALVYLN